MKSHPWRKIFRLGSRLTMAVLLISATSCSERETAGTDYTQFVNPLIGTGGHGHTFPGPVVPHGMVQPGPDTRLDGMGFLFGVLLQRFYNQWFFA